MMDELQSERYLKLLDRLKGAAEDPEIAITQGSFADFAAREFKKLQKTFDTFQVLRTDQALHRVRIQCRRVRYAAELAEPFVGRPVARFISESKAFQDLLGSHQDAVVAEARLWELLGKIRGVKTAFIAGRLVECVTRRRRKARTGLLKARAILKKKGKKAWSYQSRALVSLVAPPSEVVTESEVPSSPAPQESSEGQSSPARFIIIKRRPHRSEHM